jgi:hypothetical protein
MLCLPSAAVTSTFPPGAPTSVTLTLNSTGRNLVSGSRKTSPPPQRLVYFCTISPDVHAATAFPTLSLASPASVLFPSPFEPLHSLFLELSCSWFFLVLQISQLSASLLRLPAIKQHPPHEHIPHTVHLYPHFLLAIITI